MFQMEYGRAVASGVKMGKEDSAPDSPTRRVGTNLGWPAKSGDSRAAIS